MAVQAARLIGRDALIARKAPVGLADADPVQISPSKTLGHAAQDLAVTAWLSGQKDQRP